MGEWSGCSADLQPFTATDHRGFPVCSYFMVNSDGKILVQQSGVFRSNCMDCLDRTNVIQSLLARRSLQSQLQVRMASAAEELELVLFL